MAKTRQVACPFCGGCGHVDNAVTRQARRRKYRYRIIWWVRMDGYEVPWSTPCQMNNCLRLFVWLGGAWCGWRDGRVQNEERTMAHKKAWNEKRHWPLRQVQDRRRCLECASTPAAMRLRTVKARLRSAR